MNKQQKFNNQFKERKPSGEHRNGRKSQYKNSSVHGGAPDEYVDDNKE
ncbi:hypothetical protein JNUCC1_01382 [Lentibacillus sp. JNUCC-1]|nr:hypothetical protein [Lentibacillus sp. JNUCC-1]MUV37576.1 hypothetical protein [Lentibacillus sp. JNUCC-1]